jgi:hypothetical protein
MVFCSGKKWPRFVLAVYLVIAIMGTCAFLAAETLDLDEWESGRPLSDSFVTSMDHAVDWLAVEPNTISRAKGQPPSPMRNGASRIFMSLEPQHAGISLVRSSQRAIINIHCLNIKNTILLKLRI